MLAPNKRPPGYCRIGNRVMRVLVCDDDKPFAFKISKVIRDYYRNREIEVRIDAFSAPQVVLEQGQLESYDVAFLDADMKPINGIQLGHKLKELKPTVILVYISAFMEFALQGYRVDTFRYLLKKDLKTDLPVCLEEVLQKYMSTNSFFEYKNRADEIRIPYNDIYYFESDLRKINIYGAEPNVVIGSFYCRFSSLVDQLGTGQFLKTGKSDLINMTYIRRIANYRVVLLNGVEKGVTRKEYSQIKDIFVEWKGKI